MDAKLLKEKYVKDLEDNFLPFWEKAMDTIFGGVYTCYTNKGHERISDRKYIWSQGRFLWLSSKLLQMKEQGIINLSKTWEVITEKTYLFLTEHALMPNNHSVFAVERDGSKIEEQMDISIFADCFYVLGCNAYAQFKNNDNAFEHALLIYHTIKKRVHNNDFQSEPYPIPNGYRSHSIPMILLNVVEELYQTACVLNQEVQNTLLKDVQNYFQEILSLKEEDRIIEMYSEESHTLLSRHLNPGHTIECAWFMLHSLVHLDLDDSDIYIKNIEQLVRRSVKSGWDDQYGGLFRFVDKYGGKPQGTLIGTPYEKLILQTWDTKLWWPHAESLYTTLLLYSLTGKTEWLDQYKKIEMYVFNTFPNVDKEIGEWIQIRDRKGNPLNQVVALPVKDPFHVIRSYIKIIQLLEGSGNFAIRNK